MAEDKNSVKNGEANTEMAPQEDGTKLPLTDGDNPEVKFTSNSNPPNGDAKIDIGSAPAFTGLSKEELMKYSDDPFWVRLRWCLFIIFWAGWVAMLVVAIVIIVQAPRCAPQEKLEWVQESAMLQYDVNNGVDVDNSGDVTPNDVVEMAKVLGMTSVYLEDLISPLNFENAAAKYPAEQLEKVLALAKENNLHVVTDFVPTQVDAQNNWFKNESYKDFFLPGYSTFNFSNPDLIDKLVEVLRDSWVEKGVRAFLMVNADTEELREARDAINAALKDQVDGAVVSNVVDMSNELVVGFDAVQYLSFLNEHVNDWSYYKFNPMVAESKLSSAEIRLVTISLFLVPGTPVVAGIDKDYLEAQKNTIKTLSDIRMKEAAVKVGNITFLNSTNEDVVAYTRVLKGTPGYAVAVNMHPTNNATVDFTTINGVDGTGDVSIKATPNMTLTDKAALGKKDLSNVFLEPYEGFVIQFVPDL